MQWKYLTSPDPKKVKIVSSAGMLMASAFCDDAKHFVLTDYLERGHTINGEGDANLLRQLWNNMKTKHPGSLMKCPCFIRSIPLLTNPWFQWLLHITVALIWLTIDPILLIWTPFGYHLFPNINKHLDESQCCSPICCSHLFWSTRWKLLLQSDPMIAIPLEEVWELQWDLYWKINLIWSDSIRISYKLFSQPPYIYTEIL